MPDSQITGQPMILQGRGKEEAQTQHKSIKDLDINMLALLYNFTSVYTNIPSCSGTS